MLTAYDLAQFCQQHAIPLAARGSATSSLVAWCLGLIQASLCPLDHGLDGQLFIHEGRGDLPDLDLEVPSLHEPAVSYQEIGELLGMPVGSIGPTRARCLSTLRQRLGDAGITADSAGSEG